MYTLKVFHWEVSNISTYQTLPLLSVPIQLCLLAWKYYRSIWRRTLCGYLTFFLPMYNTLACESILHIDPARKVVIPLLHMRDIHLVPGNRNGNDTDVARRYVENSLIEKCQCSYFSWLPTPRDSNISRISMWFLRLNERNLQMEEHILMAVEREPTSAPHIVLLVQLLAVRSYTVHYKSNSFIRMTLSL
jgi:hypothetical protein